MPRKKSTPAEAAATDADQKDVERQVKELIADSLDLDGDPCIDTASTEYDLEVTLDYASTGGPTRVFGVRFVITEIAQ